MADISKEKMANNRLFDHKSSDRVESLMGLPEVEAGFEQMQKIHDQMVRTSGIGFFTRIDSPTAEQPEETLLYNKSS